MQPEGRFIDRVHRYLPSHIHQQSMRGIFHNGTPDRYYEGPDGILWVEYKWRKSKPRKPLTPALTALQRRWLNRAYGNGVEVAVIVGCPDGGYILTHGEWDNPIPVSTLSLCSVEDISKWIKGVVHYG